MPDDDGHRWRGWWCKRYGWHQLAFLTPPVRAHRVMTRLMWRPPHVTMWGVQIWRDDEGELNVVAGMWPVVADLVALKWSDPDA